MKTKLFVSLSVLCLGILLLSPQLSILASPSREAKASIPFDFYVKDTRMPGGDYNFLESETSLGVLWVEGTASPEGTVTFAITENPINPIKQGKLVFHKYGDQYFLAELWNPVLGTELVVLPSHAEKEARETIKEHQTSSVARPEMVTIALNFTTGPSHSYKGKG